MYGRISGHHHHHTIEMITIHLAWDLFDLTNHTTTHTFAHALSRERYTMTKTGMMHGWGGVGAGEGCKVEWL